MKSTRMSLALILGAFGLQPLCASADTVLTCNYYMGIHNKTASTMHVKDTHGNTMTVAVDKTVSFMTYSTENTPTQLLNIKFIDPKTQKTNNEGQIHYTVTVMNHGDCSTTWPYHLTLEMKKDQHFYSIVANDWPKRPFYANVPGYLSLTVTQTIIVAPPRRAPQPID